MHFGSAATGTPGPLATVTINMRTELPDTDEGAELALKDYEIITKARKHESTKAQMDRINGRPAAMPGATVTGTVLAMLRQKMPHD